MKPIITYIIIGIIGTAVGVAANHSVMQPKINRLNNSMTEITSRSQESEERAQQSVRNANAEISRLHMELARVKAELEGLKSNQPAQKGQLTQSAQSQQQLEQPVQKPIKDTLAENSQKIYVAKEGDSLWKIAANELGNGSRYAEIKKLNPNIDTDNMKIGTKLILPAK